MTTAKNSVTLFDDDCDKLYDFYDSCKQIRGHLSVNTKHQLLKLLQNGILGYSRVCLILFNVSLSVIIIFS